MAIDVCSEISSLSISPRISFSHDLNQTNLILLEDQDHDRHHDRRRLDSSSDFDFCIVTDDDFTFEISSADELFSDGKILPVEIKPKEYGQKFPDSPEPPPTSTARVKNNSSSTNPEEYKIKFKEHSQKIPDLPNLLLTSTVNSSNSTGPDEKRIKLKESGQTSPLSTSTADNSSSTGPEKKITRLKELLSSSLDTDEDEDEDEEEKTQRRSSSSGGGAINPKSFWQFRRSSSLNLEKIKSLHFMSRSNSTGSVQPGGPKKPKPGLRKQQSLNSSSAASGRPAASYYRRTSSFSGGANYYHNYGNNAAPSKGFPRKNSGCGTQYHHHGNNNVNRMVSPVLNLPQPYISKVTVSFFGFGSLFCNGKLRKKNK